MSPNNSETTPLLPERRQQTSELTELKLEDHENPRNWNTRRKWFCAILASLYALVGPVSSAMVVPALPAISRDFDINSEALTQSVLSIFVLGWCIGPLFIAPCSEIYGRSQMLNLGHTLFLITNTLCALQTNKWAFLALRFTSGFVGSAPLSLGGGVISDLWVSEERGKSLAVYTLAPLLGPGIGPILGGFMAQYVSWRWTFFAVSIFTTICLSFGFLMLEETFAPVLLKRKRDSTQARLLGPETTQLKASNERRALLKRLLQADLKRPILLLFTQPIVQALALYMAYLWGLNYLTISTFLNLFLEVYGEPPEIASLNYVSIAAGFVLGCQIAAPLNDGIYARLKKMNGGVARPEFRVYLMIPASVVLPLGLLLYGWSAEARLNWVLPNLGIIIYSFGLIISYQCIHAYTLDCYPVYAASAIGALTVMRCIGGFAFPMFGPTLFRSLGYGWGSTLLAGIALVLGGASPWVLKWKGPEWRQRSPYAAGDIKVDL